MRPQRQAAPNITARPPAAGIVGRLTLSGSGLGQAILYSIWQWTLRTGSEDLLWSEKEAGVEPLPTLADTDLPQIGLPPTPRITQTLAKPFVSAG